MQRSDDAEATVKERLRVYHDETEPLIDYYSKWAASGDKRAPRYRKIEGIAPVETIRDRAFAALS